MDLTEELRQQIRSYLAGLLSRPQLADWLVARAQDLSDLPHDGRWELQADTWSLIWQAEDGSLDEESFRRELADLLPRSPAIVQSWPPDSTERIQTSSSAETLPTESLTLTGAPT